MYRTDLNTKKLSNQLYVQRYNNIMNKKTFGEFIKTKRMQVGLSLRETARQLGVSAQYYSEVEKSIKCAFTHDKLEYLKNILSLNDTESRKMLELAMESRTRKDGLLPEGFSEYIITRDYVMTALRTAADSDAGKEEWMEFIRRLKNKQENN